jgi:hypothetical protein
MRRRGAWLALAVLLPLPAAAQRITADWGLQGIPLLTQTNVVPGGHSLGEARIVQPIAMLDLGAWGGRARLRATIDFEKWTIPHGELTPGAWGEGFVDRRHPHTIVHELMLELPDLLGRDAPVHVFLAGGKGFVPFGTDDPMGRPIVRFPVNHHLSQILERAVAMAGVRRGRLALEAALFNGDEPISPGSWPVWKRFGDSWAGRLTAEPLAGLEAQVSLARVKSPENRPGAGLNDAKTNVSLRWESGRVYGLVEWSRTNEGDGTNVFHSTLAEGSVRTGILTPYLRFERTERPEEQRTFESLFRTVLPVFENSLLGITRWTIATAGGQLAVINSHGARVTPFAEVSYLGIARVGGGVFDPASFYGRTHGYSLSVGVRMGYGMTMHRMGRYGRSDSMPMPMEMGR